MSIIKFKNVSKKFAKREVIKNLNFDVEEGEFVALVGPSGAGKSTVLNMIGLLETHDGGEIFLEGEKLPKPESKQATHLRRDKINYLFQSFALISSLTVGQNLMFALKFMKKTEKEKLAMIMEALASLGIADKIDDVVNTLSGGEQQRVSLARAMLKPGKLVLADEPTGALDPVNAEIAFGQIRRLRDEFGKTIVMVTHNMEEAKQADRMIVLKG